MVPYNSSVRTPDEDDIDFEAYFKNTYKPLSNLPTPPPSKRNSAAPSPINGLEDGELIDSQLLGPAIHLVNLLPPSASIATPSVALVQAILTRANLPIDIIALAVCVLDSLDNRFARKWRMTLPLKQALSRGPSLKSKRHTITATSGLYNGEGPHIDLVSPEVIILTALVIAFKFVEDCQEPTQYYASNWGKELWTCEQLNATERCIMENLDYRILPLWERELIDDARSDMKRAGKLALKESTNKNLKVDHSRSVSVPVSAGNAVLGLGLQLTPMDTPIEERIRETSELSPQQALSSRLEGLIDEMTHP